VAEAKGLISISAVDFNQQGGRVAFFASPSVVPKSTLRSFFQTVSP